MWDWWFSWHSYTSECYQRWHPDDHVAASLDQDRRSESSNHLASILPELHERFGHEYVLEIAAS